MGRPSRSRNRLPSGNAGPIRVSQVSRPGADPGLHQTESQAVARLDVSGRDPPLAHGRFPIPRHKAARSHRTPCRLGRPIGRLCRPGGGTSPRPLPPADFEHDSSLDTGLIGKGEGGVEHSVPVQRDFRLCRSSSPRSPTPLQQRYAPGAWRRTSTSSARLPRRPPRPPASTQPHP